MTQNNRFEKALSIFRKNDGILRTGRAIHAGIHPSTLYQLRDMGKIERISRGVYRLTEMEPLYHPDFVIVATRIPNGVICLISALSFHELTTQIPHRVHVALPRGTEEPVCDYPPIQTHRFSETAFSTGIEIYNLDRVDVRIYSPEKTIADSFKFRNKIGIDTVVEALRMYRERKEFNIDDLMRYARICRVETTIRPYLEAIV
jgi:predicted transcriptional regulator of viral defense system